MTSQIEAGDFTTGHFQNVSAAARAVAAGASACFSRFLAGLDESRRLQAAIERARYRYLIFDAETGIYFGMNATAQKPPPSK